MTDKDELEQYETSEGRDAVRMIRKLSPPPVERAPPSFQNAVMRRIKKGEAPSKNFAWTPWYQVPLPIAAGLILGVVLALSFLSLEQTVRIDDHLDFRGKPGDSHPVDRRIPEEWLESIAELLVKGQVAKAYQELGEFKKHHPDYEQKSKK
ncbi:MAG: hypothetical protein V3U75_10655 [Methylococcaceae bacterium]